MQRVAIAAISKQVEPSETSQNLPSMDNPIPHDEEDDDEDDYSASVCAIMQRRSSSCRQSRRKPGPSFSIDIENAARRRSSAYTMSSGDTIISMEESSNQEQIFENLKLHKEVLSIMKQQPWPLRRKIKLVRQAKAYIRQHEGALQERFAQSRSTKDAILRVSLFMTKKWQYFRRELINLQTWLIPWQVRIMEIESHFGSAVASYFIFLRWLFWINLVIAATLMAFVVIPEILTANKTLAGERKIMLNEDNKKSTHFLTLWQFEGVLKYSPFFYGWYTNQDSNKNYKLPLAYFVTNVIVYTYSFVAILRKMAKNSRLSKLTEKKDEYIFSWKLFTGWDFMIGNPETSHNRTASIVLGFKEALLEEAEKQKDKRNWKIILMRIFVNIAVLSLLASSAFAVITVVERSIIETHNWWRQNEITIVMSMIAFIFPMIFEILGLLENYHPRNQLRIQLARIMLLNLLNLYSLIFALFRKINCMTKELCKLKPREYSTKCEYKLITCPNENMTRTQHIAILTSLTFVLMNTTHSHIKREISRPASFSNEFFLNPILDDSAYKNFSDAFKDYDYDSDYDQYENSDTTSSESNTMSSYENENTQSMHNTYATRYDTSSPVTINYVTDSTTAKDHDSWNENTSTTIEPDARDNEETSSPFLNTEESVGRNNVSTIIDDTLTTIAKYTPEDDTSILPPTKLPEEKCYEKTCTSTCTSSKNLAMLAKQMDLKERRKLHRLCWETSFGQELAKLTVMDLILTVIASLNMDFFRAVFVRFMNNCWCWDLEKQFPQYGDFKIAENILHLVNNQGMIWMGMFFSPGLTALNLIKLGILMYLRSWAVLTCNVPHEVIFRASRSNNFYFALLLTMLFLCVLPVGYAIVWIEPSWHCGPFSNYSKIYNLATDSLPELIQECFNYIASPAMVIPLIVLMTLIIYYMASLAGSLREANNDLKIQLRHERTEERRKLFKIAEKKQNTAETPHSRWKKILPALPQAGISQNLEVTQKDNPQIAVINLNGTVNGKQSTNDAKEEELTDRDEMLNNACYKETQNEQDDLNNISSSKRPISFVESAWDPQLNEQSIIPEIQINEETEMSDDTNESMEPSNVSEDHNQDIN